MSLPLIPESQSEFVLPPSVTPLSLLLPPLLVPLSVVPPSLVLPPFAAVPVVVKV